jgi:hypothetical protein
LVLCTNCQQPKPTHIACPHCGFYGNKKILTTKTDKRITARLKRDQAVAARKAKTEAKKKAAPKKSTPKQSSTLAASRDRGQAKPAPKGSAKQGSDKK